MLELIMVRHGETDFSSGRYCGWTDAELNKNGIIQAEKAAALLKGSSPVCIFTSPLKRAIKTAEFISAVTDSAVSEVSELKERNFGIWENMTYKEIEAAYPEECSKWNADINGYRVRKGESADEVYKRVTGFIDDLVHRNGKGTFILVTHLGCLRVILAHLLGLGQEGIWRFRADCGSITRVEVDETGFAFLTGLNIRF